MRRKHADLVHAWIRLANRFPPYWDTETEDRIKPQKKPDVVKYYRLSGRFNLNPVDCDGCGNGDLKITFDGDTGKLINAEVIERN